MHYLISLLVLAACGGALGAAGRLVPLRRNAYAVYADSSGEEYEPYAVVPLQHLPLLQVLSPAPSPAPPRRRRPAKRPRPAPDAADLYAFDASHAEQAYEPAGYSELYSAELEPQPAKHKPRDQYEEDASSVVVYARPDRHGGYSYRRPPHAAPAAPAPYAAPAPRPRDPQEPVIIRIHKYRVIH